MRSSREEGKRRGPEPFQNVEPWQPRRMQNVRPQWMTGSLGVTNEHGV